MDTAKKSGSAKERAERFVSYLKSLRLSWTTVVVLAVLLAFADGFVLLAFQGAVGAVERQSEPFRRWIIGSLILVPFFAAAVVVAMILTVEVALALTWSWLLLDEHFGPVKVLGAAVVIAGVLLAQWANNRATTVAAQVAVATTTGV